MVTVSYGRNIEGNHVIVAKDIVLQYLGVNTDGKERSVCSIIPTIGPLDHFLRVIECVIEWTLLLRKLAYNHLDCMRCMVDSTNQKLALVQKLTNSLCISKTALDVLRQWT